MKNFFLNILAVLAIYPAVSNLQATSLETSMHPTLGDSKAPVEVVVFLEPKCPDSKRYNDASFPKLQKEFIDTNKVRYTAIITSFLPQSMPAAIALLCVYNQDSNKPRNDLFFSYLDYIYKNQPPESENWATIETLQKFAVNASPGIDQNQLKNCIEKGHYSAQVEKNTAYGNQLMGHLSTPTIFVDGVKVENKEDTVDYDNLKDAIQKALADKQKK